MFSPAASIRAPGPELAQLTGHIPNCRNMLSTWLAQAAWNAVKAAARPRVHVFLATSPIHMQFKLNMTEDQVVANSVRTVQHLRSLGCQDIEFSPEDATRWGRWQPGSNCFTQRTACPGVDSLCSAWCAPLASGLSFTRV